VAAPSIQCRGATENGADGVVRSDVALRDAFPKIPSNPDHPDRAGACWLPRGLPSLHEEGDSPDCNSFTPSETAPTVLLTVPFSLQPLDLSSD
jgi:hypothetical protein